MNDLSIAKEQLLRDKMTCVLRRGDTVYTSSRRGVAPLLELLEDHTDVSGFSVADRVVGQGAAFLYVILQVKEVHALVMSRPALDTLQMHGIAATADEFVPSIRNRQGNGPCPMEAAVAGITDPAEALKRIKEAARRLASEAKR